MASEAIYGYGILCLCFGIFLTIVGRLTKGNDRGFVLLGLAILCFIIAGFLWGGANTTGKIINLENLPEGKIYKVAGISNCFFVISYEKEGQTLKDYTENARLVWRWPSSELEEGQEFTVKDGKIEVIFSTPPTSTEYGEH